MKTKNTVTRSPGRPREFDSQQVLDAAIRQFSLQGYHGSSIATLSQATGLTAGSLYKAYTDKRGLFCAALQHYISVNKQHLDQQLTTVDSGLAAIRLLLTHYLNRSNGEAGHTGSRPFTLGTADGRATGGEKLAFQF